MTRDQQRDHVAAFGRAGLPALDATLRRLEAELAAVGAAV
jgi:hypothetical protein